ncbi:MAG: 3-keto-5-aminohexanoate cleavage protein [Dinoroseobacter sp.]|nr:3-keto-5-aminohexanoate cleavage protein [Dinoroseobacter sp.]
MIMAAPNGARKTKRDHPALPITIAETVETARACVAASADALHLHVRDTAGLHSLDPGLYREALAELDRVLPGLPVQVTTESAGVYEVEAQLALLRDLRPKWASVALRELDRAPELARRIYREADEIGAELQHIVFDASDAALLGDLQRKGVLREDASVILVLGRYAADANSNPADLQPLLASLPPVGKWMLCAFGPNEHACLLEAAKLGGDLRVGFENSVTAPDGSPWPSMAASIAALREGLREAA